MNAALLTAEPTKHYYSNLQLLKEMLESDLSSQIYLLKPIQ